MKQLKEDVQTACAERDGAASEKALDSELDRMQTNIRCLTEERDQLQEMLQGLREEKSQLKRELEEKDEMVREELAVNDGTFYGLERVSQLEPLFNIKTNSTAMLFSIQGTNQASEY